MSTPYNFPVSNPVHAMRVTSTDFQVDLFENNLYTEFDEIRSKETLDQIKFSLGIMNNQLEITNSYETILVSGHRGCGKSSELKRLHSEINQPHLYTSIFISIEEEFSLGDFSQEKLYLTLLSKLVERMEVDGINMQRAALDDLIKLLTQERTKETTSNIEAGVNGSLETGGGVDILGFFKAKGEVKSSLAYDKTFTDKIITNIRLNLVDFLEKVNLLLIDIRAEFASNKKGEDIVFIIDGSEKIPFEEYRKTFVTNAATLKILRTNMIVCLSIQAWYEIENSPYDFTNRYLIPMLSTANKDTYIKLLKATLAKRITVDNLIEENALEYILINAAGCIRQMYILVNHALTAALGAKVNLDHAEEAICKEGKRLYEQLTTGYFEILKKIDANQESIHYADPDISKLLFGLQLLKYNGNSKVNPVIKEYLRLEKNETLS